MGTWGFGDQLVSKNSQYQIQYSIQRQNFSTWVNLFAILVKKLDNTIIIFRGVFGARTCISESVL